MCLSCDVPVAKNSEFGFKFENLPVSGCPCAAVGRRLGEGAVGKASAAAGGSLGVLLLESQPIDGQLKRALLWGSLSRR